MNAFSRLVAAALFAVLVALVAMLALPVWRQAGAETASPPTVDARAEQDRAPAVSTRALVLSQRVALALAVVALALTLPLLLSAITPPATSPGTRHPLEEVRTEVSALARLAESSAAQGEELSRERDVRRRAEEDARLKQQLLTQELDEKIRLGRDLHDGIIQSVYAAGLTLESVRTLLKTQPDEAALRLDQTRTSLNEAIRDIRGYIAGLAPESLRRTGFARALTHLLGELGAGHAAQFDLQVDDEAAAHLSPEQSIELLQIAREAVSNALRHGHASKVTVRMHQGDQAVCLLVQDDGSGFAPERAGHDGHGLANMHARAERLGASLRLTSQAGGGTRVLATLPVVPAPTP